MVVVVVVVLVGNLGANCMIYLQDSASHSI